jgi:hypothetical protein
LLDKNLIPRKSFVTVRIHQITNPAILNKNSSSTSNYELRIDTSGCYCLDQNNIWNSAGLVVRRLTNHYQTQMSLNTILGRFSSGLTFPSSPMNWNYVFTRLNFLPNKTIDLTIILVSRLYIILMIYARIYNRTVFKKLVVISRADNHP